MMAIANDMPELHSVKVFVTKNTPPRRRHGFVNTSNSGIHSLHGFTGTIRAGGFTRGYLPLTFAGGQAHV
ncbi:hypothetical protein SG34_032540 [Thalassomonas viridans]|uniref:Uncharacterized protein n=1 Tax=Thalassomonas viridans TaxID=137584 RepID=A0AAE9Z9C7_9GAMM|nr:hypothetical protein [Thalassomonas viridans]WDE08647.1 hypothetical protein SG34_032540 [Thalassomonas viridans]